MRTLLIILIALAALPANATLLSFSFNGQFSQRTPLGTEVSIGDNFYASFSYDDNASLSSIINEGTRVVYRTGSLSMKTGNNFYKAVDNPGLQILDNWVHPDGSKRDSFFLSVYQYDVIGAGFYLLQLDMNDSSLLSLNSVNIPNIPTLVDMASNGRVFLRRFSSNNKEEWNTFGHFNTITAVPLPATFWLFSLAYLLLFQINRKK